LTDSSVMSLADATARVQRPTPWQRVIHGDCTGFRQGMLEALAETESAEAAGRYAMCGMGDRMCASSDGREFGVRPQGCGSPVCPRCSRRKGLRMLKKVKARLASGGHESLYHMVLTQRVVAGEPLSETAKRFQDRVNVWMTRVRKDGRFVGGFGSIHIVWSRAGGWHYHMHLLLETSDDEAAASFSATWGTTLVPNEVDGHAPNEAFVRHVADAGGCREIAGALESTEFWREPEDEVSKALAYVIRDALKGVDVAGVGRAGRERFREVVAFLKKRRCFRLYGAWREEVAAAAGQEEEGADTEIDRAGGEKAALSLDLGTMDHVFYEARKGASMPMRALCWLEAQCRNNGGLGKRVVAFARSVA